MIPPAPKPEQLQECAKRLDRCCRALPEWQWPSWTIYTEFNSVVRALYRQYAATKHPSPILWDAIKAVDRRWPGLRLDELLNGLVDRVVTNIPAGPATKLLHITSAPQTTPERKSEIEALVEQLRTFTVFSRTPALTHSHLEILLPLTSQEFQRTFAKPRRRTQLDHDAFIKEYQPFISWAAFTDVQRQHLLWLRTYERDVLAFAQWIVGLQNDALSAKLKAILSGDITPATGYRAVHKKRQTKARVARHRKKSSE